MTAQARMCVLTVPTLSVSSSNSYCVQGTIASIPLCLLVDTGAAVSLLSADMPGIKSALQNIPLSSNNGLDKD